MLWEWPYKENKQTNKQNQGEWVPGRLSGGILPCLFGASGGCLQSLTSLGLELHPSISASIFTCLFPWSPSASSPLLRRTPVIGRRVHPQSRILLSRSFITPQQITYLHVMSLSEVPGSRGFRGILFNPCVGAECLWDSLEARNPFVAP